MHYLKKVEGCHVSLSTLFVHAKNTPSSSKILQNASKTEKKYSMVSFEVGNSGRQALTCESH